MNSNVNNASNTRALTQTALLCAITAVLAQISIPLPFSPVPFSLGLVGALLSGGLLGKKYAASAQAVYLLVGMAGLPVFSGFRSGLAAAVGPTGGYLLAYPFMAWGIAYIREKSGRGFAPTLFSMFPALALCYALGSLWLSISAGMSFWAALCAGVLPYVAFDVIKLIMTAFFVIEIEKRLANTIRR